MKIRRNLFTYAVFTAVLFDLFLIFPDRSYGQEINNEARRESVTNLEIHIQQRYSRLNSIKRDIRQLDKRVEDGIENIVKLLSEIRDSEESKVRVARLKADVISKLRLSIEHYDRYRKSIKEQLRKDSAVVSRKDLKSDLAIFDQHIEKRVSQIKVIAESFSEPQELEKYEVKGQSTEYSNWRWRSNNYENEEISEAWKQDRRESKHTDSMKDQVLQGLRESIAHLEKRNDYLRGKLKEGKITRTEQELYRSDVERNMEVIETRTVQIESFLSSDPVETDTVDRQKAHETEHLVEGLVSDLKEDFFSIFRKYAELNSGRSELHQLSTNLTARKKWLSDYDASQ